MAEIVPGILIFQGPGSTEMDLSDLTPEEIQLVSRSRLVLCIDGDEHRLVKNNYGGHFPVVIRTRKDQ